MLDSFPVLISSLFAQFLYVYLELFHYPKQVIKQKFQFYLGYVFVSLLPTLPGYNMTFGKEVPVRYETWMYRLLRKPHIVKVLRL